MLQIDKRSIMPDFQIFGWGGNPCLGITTGFHFSRFRVERHPIETITTVIRAISIIVLRTILGRYPVEFFSDETFFIASFQHIIIALFLKRGSPAEGNVLMVHFGLNGQVGQRHRTIRLQFDYPVVFSAFAGCFFYLR